MTTVARKGESGKVTSYWFIDWYIYCSDRSYIFYKYIMVGKKYF
ncbi:MAG: hypothetical protein ACRC1Z_04850 [Waterburya sp.]